jgi:hypothetical protein
VAKNSFVMYHEWKTYFDMLTLDEKGELITAIFEYQVNEKVNDNLSPMLLMAFAFMKNQFDRDSAAYEEKRQQLVENGKKGGRPKKPKGSVNNQKEPKGLCENQTKAKKAVNVNVNSNANDNGNVIANEGVNGMLPSSTAPPLSEEERQALLTKGIPEVYINERLQRAEAYALQRQNTVFDVLCKWWEADKMKQPRQSDKTGDLGNSFDIDDFFQAALEKSFAGTEVTE